MREMRARDKSLAPSVAEGRSTSDIRDIYTITGVYAARNVKAPDLRPLSIIVFKSAIPALLRNHYSLSSLLIIPLPHFGNSFSSRNNIPFPYLLQLERGCEQNMSVKSNK